MSGKRRRVVDEQQFQEPTAAAAAPVPGTSQSATTAANIDIECQQKAVNGGGALAARQKAVNNALDAFAEFVLVVVDVIGREYPMRGRVSVLYRIADRWMRTPRLSRLNEAVMLYLAGEGSSPCHPSKNEPSKTLNVIALSELRRIAQQETDDSKDKATAMVICAAFANITGDDGHS